MVVWRQEADIGLSGSKQTTTTGPSAAATPHLNAATGAITSAYNSAQPIASNIGSSLADAFASFNTSRQNNPLTAGANDYLGKVIGGEYLDGSPQLQGVIDQTNDSVTDRVNAIFARAGHSGSSRQYGELGKQLADNETRLRYQNYSDEQTRIGQAISQALAMRGADNQDIATLLALGQGAVEIPLAPSQAYASGIGGLWGNSQTQTTKDSGSVVGSLGGLLSSAASAKKAFSDRRLKQNIEKIGEEPDGLGIYRFSYIDPPNDRLAALMPNAEGGDRRFVGVMADEIEVLRPWALGPVVEGYRTVDYGAL